jgi:hypothetical protein
MLTKLVNTIFSDSIEVASSRHAAANSTMKPSLKQLRAERKSTKRSESSTLPLKTLKNRLRALRMKLNRSLIPASRSSRRELRNSKTTTTLSSAKLPLMSLAVTQHVLTLALILTTSNSMRSQPASLSASAP